MTTPSGTTAITSSETLVRKKPAEDIKIKTPKTGETDLEMKGFWEEELWKRKVLFRDEILNLEAARLKLDEADKEYREALRVQNYQLHEALSLCVDAVLERLPLAERRFIIKELSGIARYWSGRGDIIISRSALMKFIESLVFYCM